MNTKHTPDHWTMFSYSNTGTDVTYKILASWDDLQFEGGVIYQISESITNIEETALSFIVTDSSQDVFTCEKSKYGFTEITTNIFNNMVQAESQIHQWMLNVPFTDIHSS
jgi:hypothetical protein